MRWLTSVVVAVLALAVTPTAPANSFGHNYLETPAPYYFGGTRASVLTPASTSFMVVPTHCLSFRSDTESTFRDQLIQTGYLKCAPGYAADGNPSCALFELYVEIWNNGPPVCYAQGAAVYDREYKFSVADLDINGTYQAYIDGAAKGPLTSQWSTPELMVEGGEYTGDPQCGHYTGDGVYGLATPWQRYNSDRVWYTVQTSYRYIGTCWEVGAPAPPNAFYVSHR